MIVIGVSREQLDDALDATTREFGWNVIWNRTPEPMNKRGDRWSLTLRVEDSKGPGARLGLKPWVWKAGGVEPSGTQRHMISACWHVHGVFIKHILDMGGTIKARGTVIDTHKKNWKDYNQGPPIFPQFASELCACKGRPRGYK